MNSDDPVVQRELQQRFNVLIIDGSKYTANGDFEKAANCYTQLLDLESQNPEYYVLLAKCLYQLGLQKNDMFGGGQTDDATPSDSDDGDGNNDENAQEDDDFGSESENEPEQGKLVLNQRFFQFDQEEEEITDSSDNAEYADDSEHNAADEDGHDEEEEGEGKDHNGDGVSNTNDDVEGALEALSRSKGNTSNLSIEDSFQNYLKGDVFENALELLFRARTMYIELLPSSFSPASSSDPSSPSSSSTSRKLSLSSPSSSSKNSKKDIELKLVEIYDLLGDIDQELEDFAQSISDYQESIRYYSLAVSMENDEKVINIYLKMAESLRWLDSDDKNITKVQHKNHLEKISELIQKRIDSGESDDLEEDKQRLERLREDLDVLEKGKLNIKDKFLTQSSMMEALLQHALSKTQRSKVNDLSNMVKKKKARK